MAERLGTATFVVEVPWRLIVPDAPAPPGGWPLVVALHGQGQSAAYFARLAAPMIQDWGAWLFPEGPWSHEIRREAKIRIGHAWYLYDGSDDPFRPTLGRAEAHVLGLIDRLAASEPIDPARVALFGFSQGAYTGYFITLRNTNRFRGMVAYGGGRLKPEFVDDRLPGAPRIPYLLLHGEQDESIPFERTELMRGELADRGFPVELATVPGGHGLGEEGLARAGSWLRDRLL